MDREEIVQLVGKKVAVRLNSAEALGVELRATLEETREDGILLTDIGELGPGPTIFCPWESLRTVRDRWTWPRPPHEEQTAGEGAPGEESYELREVSEVEAAPEPLPEFRTPIARTLERVVPVAQKSTVGGVTVAIASLELYGEGLGVLRWMVSFEGDLWDIGNDTGVPEPRFEIRDSPGRDLTWLPQGGGASDGEASGDVMVEGLPDTGALSVEVPRLVADAYEDGGYRGDGPSFDGPWSFQFTV